MKKHACLEVLHLRIGTTADQIVESCGIKISTKKAREALVCGLLVREPSKEGECTYGDVPCRKQPQTINGCEPVEEEQCSASKMPFELLELPPRILKMLPNRTVIRFCEIKSRKMAIIQG